MSVRAVVCCLIAVLSVILLSPVALGQGVPGDGIPDVYYWTTEATAPNGEVRTTGVLQLDTDGTDLVDLALSSPTIFVDEEFCILCDGDELPVAQIFGTSFRTDVNFWFRVSPDAGPGPIGIFDLADDGEGEAEFPLRSNGFSAKFTNVAGEDFFFDVTPVVPEPSGLALLAMTALAFFHRLRG